MTIAQKIKQIEQLQVLEAPPWEVRRFFGKVSIMGNQISLNDGDADYGTLEEVQVAVTWLVEQLGGTCSFETKKEKKAKK